MYISCSPLRKSFYPGPLLYNCFRAEEAYLVLEIPERAVQDEIPNHMIHLMPLALKFSRVPSLDEPKEGITKIAVSTYSVRFLAHPRSLYLLQASNQFGIEEFPNSIEQGSICRRAAPHNAFLLEKVCSDWPKKVKTD